MSRRIKIKLRPASRRLSSNLTLLRELLAVLINHAGENGDNEGAVETLNRIIAERDKAIRLLGLKARP